MFDTDKPDLEKWKVLEKKTIYQCDPWIRLDVHKVKLPAGSLMKVKHHWMPPSENYLKRQDLEEVNGELWVHTCLTAIMVVAKYICLE